MPSWPRQRAVPARSAGTDVAATAGSTGDTTPAPIPLRMSATINVVQYGQCSSAAPDRQARPVNTVPPPRTHARDESCNRAPSPNDTTMNAASWMERIDAACNGPMCCEPWKPTREHRQCGERGEVVGEADEEYGGEAAGGEECAGQRRLGGTALGRDEDQHRCSGHGDAADGARSGPPVLPAIDHGEGHSPVIAAMRRAVPATSTRVCAGRSREARSRRSSPRLHISGLPPRIANAS